MAASRKIVILTKTELRHRFFKMALALTPGIEVLHTFCEEPHPLIESVLNADESDLRKHHLLQRLQSEKDFFEAFTKLAPDHSRSTFIPNGSINELKYYDEINEINPDLLIAFGCSIIREPLLSRFEGRFLNVHLGLSPYYRGAGTNFWPLVNGEPEYVGATFMHIDAGVDTGRSIHQIRARIYSGDTPHQIGNRLILDMTQCFGQIIKNFDTLSNVDPIPLPSSTRYYKRRDFSDDSVKQLYLNFDQGLIDKYLNEQETRTGQVPITLNPQLEVNA